MKNEYKNRETLWNLVQKSEGNNMERITNTQLKELLRLLVSKDRKKNTLTMELLSALLELYCFREMLENGEVIPQSLCARCPHFEKDDDPMKREVSRGMAAHNPIPRNL